MCYHKNPSHIGEPKGWPDQTTLKKSYSLRPAAFPWVGAVFAARLFQKTPPPTCPIKPAQACNPLKITLCHSKAQRKYGVVCYFVHVRSHNKRHMVPLSSGADTLTVLARSKAVARNIAPLQLLVSEVPIGPGNAGIFSGEN